MCQQNTGRENLTDLQNDSLCFLDFQLTAYIIWLIFSALNFLCCFFVLLGLKWAQLLRSATHFVVSHEMLLEMLGSVWNIVLAVFHLKNIVKRRPEVMLPFECYKWAMNNIRLRYAACLSHNEISFEEMKQTIL